MKKLLLVLLVSIVSFRAEIKQEVVRILAIITSFLDFDDGTCIYEGCFDPEADN